MSHDTANGDESEGLAIGDRFAGWVSSLMSDEEGNFVPVLLFDEFERVTESVASGVEETIGMRGSASESLDEGRRWFLKQVGTGTYIATTGYTVWDMYGDVTRTSKQHFRQFWPDALFEFAKQTSGDLTVSVLQRSHLPWDKNRATDEQPNFLKRSTTFLTDESNRGDDIFISTVFFRAIKQDMFTAFKNAEKNDNTVHVGFADPRPGRSGWSPLDRHEDREVLLFQYYVNSRPWQRLAMPLSSTPWDEVPHPNDPVLNRIRAHLESLRMIQTALYLSTRRDNVRFYPIDNTEKMSLRGRIIGRDKMASFVRLEKGLIGTTNPTKGYVTENQQLVRELHHELDDLSTRLSLEDPDPFTDDELTETYDEVQAHARATTEEAVEEGLLTEEQADELRDVIDDSAFDLPSASAFDVPYSEWRERMDQPIRNRITDDALSILDEAEPEPFEECDPTLGEFRSMAPRRAYEKSLSYQGLA